MPALDGSGIPVDLGGEVTLVAPGLVGDADREPELLGVRAGEEAATPALAAALADAGLEQVHGVRIHATEVPVPGSDLRGPEDEGLMVLQVPDLGPGAPQVLLLVDEAGVATWHFGEQATDAPGRLEFTLPREVAVAPVAGARDPEERGLAAMIGQKLLSVLVFGAAEAAAGIAARVLADRFERRSRPYRLRRFVPGYSRIAGDGDLVSGGWDALDGGRALLLVHGTFSTSHGGFSGLPDDALGALWSAYDGRVIAFDHPTLSATPSENAATLAGMVPPGRTLEVDVVSHSRGGLVARALADLVDGPVRVRGTVFVGTPNAGTALADDANIKSLVDRMTTMLNLVPDGPWSVVTDVLSGVLEVVKVLAVGAVDGLPGLQAMDPADSGLSRLGSAADPAVPRWTIDAEYEPSGSLVSLVRLADVTLDRVFGKVPNDLVVPADVATAPPGVVGFPVPPESRFSFGRTPSVWHCSYFSMPETADRLRAWCRPVEEG